MPRDKNPRRPLFEKNDPVAPLTGAEWDTLAALLKRATWPLPPHVFRTLINKTVSVPIELVVLTADSTRVLMSYREDEEYTGYHLPGTVLRDNENISMALERLIKIELSDACVSNPVFADLVETPKGNNKGQNPTRHEISLVFTCWIVGPYKVHGKFFYLDNLPENTLSHHHVLVEVARKWLWKMGL